MLGPTIVDYSQPLPQASPVTPEQYGSDVSPESEATDPQTLAAMADFEQARSAFYSSDYDGALDAVHRAIEQLPDDAALHEFRGLVLFAQGNYQEAAATVHAVLSGGPGWDWETMSGLYPSVEVYTTHLRALESYARANTQSADARFLLGYHYMTEGYQDAGLRQFERVLELQPDDALAQRIVQSAQPTESESEDIPLVVPGPTFAAPSDETAEPDVVETPPAPPESDRRTGEHSAAKPTVEQLTGSWSADNEQGAKFQLTLNDDGTFTWRFTEGDQTGSLDGKYEVAGDLLVLESDSGPPMIGRISEAGADEFKFRILGTAEEDPGLKFSK